MVNYAFLNILALNNLEMNGNNESEKGVRVYTSPKLPEASYLSLAETNTGPQISDSSNFPLFKLDLRIPKISDFIQSLQDQVQRISPSFTFKYTPQPPLTQVLNLLKQAIDAFLERYSKLQSSGDYTFNKNLSQDKEESMINKSNNTDDTKNAEDTMKNLCRYELLLKKKEWKLNDEKKLLHEETENLKIIEENMKQVKEAFEAEKSEWLMKKYSEKEAIESEKKKIGVEKATIEKIMDDLKQMQLRVESKNAETVKLLELREQKVMNLEEIINKKSEEVSKEKLELSQQKTKLDQEKWNINQLQHITEEKEALLSLKAKHINLDKIELENEKSKLNFAKSSFAEDQKQFFLEKEAFLKEQQSSILSIDRNPDLDTFNISSDHSISPLYYEQKSQELCIREQEIDHAYSELTEQMTRFNQELEEREQIISLNSENLSKREQDINRQYQDFKLIEACLFESKQEMEEFRLGVIPELEQQSQLLNDLFIDLKEKKNIMECTINKLNKQLCSVKAVKGKLEIISEAVSESSSDDSPSPVTSSESICDNFGKHAKSVIDNKFDREGNAYRVIEEIIIGEAGDEFKEKEIEKDKEGNRIEVGMDKQEIEDKDLKEIAVRKVLLRKRHDLPYTKLAISKTIDRVLSNHSEINEKNFVNGEEKR